MKVIVTGGAGFIGMHCSERLLKRGDSVIVVDNYNEYYDVSLKRARAVRLSQHSNLKIYEVDICDLDAVSDVFASEKPDAVIHLAAQAGVRFSLKNPHAYIENNLRGFTNIIENCRQNHVGHLVYASSSSVYGGNETLPFNENVNVDHPLSLYAATKKANELIAHTYSHLYNLPTTGLRFFTVYGPWGRPDMALFIFAKAMLSGEPIDVFNQGKMIRDFTYIDDIVEGILRVLDKPAARDEHFNALEPNPATSSAPYRIFNIGNGRPIPLLDYISALEQALGVTAVKNFLPLQPGDVPITAADTRALDNWVNFRPGTPVVAGVKMFADWYVAYHA